MLYGPKPIRSRSFDLLASQEIKSGKHKLLTNRLIEYNILFIASESIKKLINWLESHHAHADIQWQALDHFAGQAPT